MCPRHNAGREEQQPLPGADSSHTELSSKRGGKDESLSTFPANENALSLPDCGLIRRNANKIPCATSPASASTNSRQSSLYNVMQFDLYRHDPFQKCIDIIRTSRANGIWHPANPSAAEDLERSLSRRSTRFCLLKQLFGSNNHDDEGDCSTSLGADDSATSRELRMISESTVNADIIQERRLEIADLNKDLLQVEEITQQLQAMAKSHGDDIDFVEHVKRTKDGVKMGLTELQRAYAQQVNWDLPASPGDGRNRSYPTRRSHRERKNDKCKKRVVTFEADSGEWEDSWSLLPDLEDDQDTSATALMCMDSFPSQTSMTPTFEKKKSFWTW